MKTKKVEKKVITTIKADLAILQRGTLQKSRHESTTLTVPSLKG